jgi:hypothetical protein
MCDGRRVSRTETVRTRDRMWKMGYAPDIDYSSESARETRRPNKIFVQL